MRGGVGVVALLLQHCAAAAAAQVRPLVRSEERLRLHFQFFLLSFLFACFPLPLQRKIPREPLKVTVVKVDAKKRDGRMVETRESCSELRNTAD